VREIVTLRPSSLLSMTRKYLSLSSDFAQQRFSTARAFGPCRLSAAIWSLTSVTVTSMPTAFIASQRSDGSAEVRRKVCSARREMVPSSSSLPSSSHQPV
jgi:hypothetical protein